MTAQATVIIPVYNAIPRLELVLTGFLRQTFRDFELIIADDGSGPPMRAFVEAFRERSPFPLKYVYQPDEGFRKTRILNSAVREAATAYLIFVDSDCIPHSRFVEAHWEHRAPETVLVGRRVDLSERVSRRLTPQDVRDGKIEKMTLAILTDALLGRGSHWDEGILMANTRWRRLFDRKEPTLLGSNYSLEKTLLERINGFNEQFIGYGGEDTELEYRLRLAGARLEWVRRQAIQYHLFHPRQAANPQNAGIVEQAKARGLATCTKGLKNLEH